MKYKVRFYPGIKYATSAYGFSLQTPLGTWYDIERNESLYEYVFTLNILTLYYQRVLSVRNVNGSVIHSSRTEFNPLRNLFGKYKAKIYPDTKVDAHHRKYTYRRDYDQLTGELTIEYGTALVSSAWLPLAKETVAGVKITCIYPEDRRRPRVVYRVIGGQPTYQQIEKAMVISLESIHTNPILFEDALRQQVGDRLNKLVILKGE